MAEVQYATNGKGNLGVTLGAIGTGLSALGGTNILNGLLGRGDPEDRPVSRYEINLIAENAALKSQMYSDSKAAELQKQLSDQAVYNAVQEGVIKMQAQQLSQLYSFTKLVIPNDNVTPGWGTVTIKPAV